LIKQHFEHVYRVNMSLMLEFHIVAKSGNCN
jgi:hypothetical protein